MKICLLNNKSFLKNKWDKFVYNSEEGTLFHTIAWRNVVKETFGFQDYYLLLIKNDRIRSVLPLFYRRNWIFGKSLISVACGNYGGICGGNVKEKLIILNKAIELSNKLNCDYIELRNFNKIMGDWIKNDYYTTLISLDKLDIDRSFGKSVKKNIKRATKAGMEFKIGKKEYLNDFFYLYSKSMKDLGIPSWPKIFFNNICNNFKEKVKIALAIYDNKIIAGDFLIEYKHILHSLFAGSNKNYNSLGTNYFIIWNSILLGKEKGCHTYDFGRSIKGSGTFNFKQHWHGKNIELKYCYYLRKKRGIPDLNPEKKIYLYLRAIWKRIPGWLTKPIGSSIIKYLH